MNAFTRPEKPPTLTLAQGIELNNHRKLAREKAHQLGHSLGMFSRLRVVNGHPTTVTVCANCAAEVTIVLNPADGSHPVQGAAVSSRCK